MSGCVMMELEYMYVSQLSENFWRRFINVYDLAYTL